MNRTLVGRRQRRGPYKKYISHPTTYKLPATTKWHWKNLAQKYASEGRSEAMGGLDFEDCEVAGGTDDGGTDVGGEIEECMQGIATIETTDSHADQLLDSAFDDNIEDTLKIDESDEFYGISRPLFPDSKCTFGEVLFLILQFYFEFSLSKKCLNRLLELLSYILPSPNLIPSSKYKLFKFVAKLSPGDKAIKHYYCVNKNCMANVVLKDGIPDRCQSCLSSFVCKNNFFFEFPLEKILIHMMEKERMYNHFKNVNSDFNSGITDIRDGTEYKKLRDMGRLNSKFDFSLVLNTDGVPVSKSSTSQLWPIQFIIPELPPKLRNLFLIVNGIYLDHIKPNMNSFLKPFTETLVKLSEQGFYWVHPLYKTSIHSRVVTPIVSVDAVARAPMQNINQFNGKNGCSTCEFSGETVEGKTGFIYKPKFNQVLRTKKRMIIKAKCAMQLQKVVKGVKGSTVLSLIPDLDIGRGFISDYMHCVLLGVCRQFLFLFFNSKHHTMSWYLGKHIAAIDNLLASIQPPNFITRLPRSISQRKYWKASEFRSWLLFYSPVVLAEFLPEWYYEHWLLLVSTMFKLLGENISVQDIQKSQIDIQQFIAGVESFYGIHQCTYNVHQLSHLPMYVQRWGPLWATSTFPFESNNGELLKVFHGTQSIQKQLASFMEISFGYRALRHFLNIETMKSQKGISLIGIPKNYNFSPIEIDALNVSNVECETHCKKYLRCRLKFGEVFTCRQYKKGKLKRNDYTIEFVTADGFSSFAEINYFAEASNGNIYFICDVMTVRLLHHDLNHVLNIIDGQHRTIILNPGDAHIYKVIRVNNCVVKLPNRAEFNL